MMRPDLRHQNLLIIAIAALVVLVGIKKLLSRGSSAPSPTSAAADANTSQPQSARTEPGSVVFEKPAPRAASRPAAQVVQKELRGGSYRLNQPSPGVFVVRTSSGLELSSLESDLRINRCSWEPRQSCVVIGGQEALLTEEFYKALPQRRFTTSPWDRAPVPPPSRR